MHKASNERRKRPKRSKPPRHAVFVELWLTAGLDRVASRDMVRATHLAVLSALSPLVYIFTPQAFIVHKNKRSKPAHSGATLVISVFVSNLARHPPNQHVSALMDVDLAAPLVPFGFDSFGRSSSPSAVNSVRAAD